MRTRKTIEQLILDQDVDGHKKLVYFKSCDDKVYGNVNTYKQDGYILTRDPKDPNASRDYETAINSHVNLTVDRSDLKLRATPETAEDRAYNPDVYKEVESRIITGNFKLKPQLSPSNWLYFATSAVNDAATGFTDMFKPSVFIRDTTVLQKVLLAFALLQVAGLFFHDIYKVEYTVLGKYMFMVMNKALDAFCSFLSFALHG